MEKGNKKQRKKKELLKYVMLKFVCFFLEQKVQSSSAIPCPIAAVGVKN